MQMEPPHLYGQPGLELLLGDARWSSVSGQEGSKVPAKVRCQYEESSASVTMCSGQEMLGAVRAGTTV